MKHILAIPHQTQEPWWLKVAGSFENDPTFEEAVLLGQEYRSLRTLTLMQNLSPLGKYVSKNCSDRHNQQGGFTNSKYIRL